MLEEIAEFPQLIVMEYIPGEEYSVDVLTREEDDPILVSRSHPRTGRNHSFTSTVEEEPDLIDSAHVISELFDLEYVVNFRFKYNADGAPKLVGLVPCISESITACVGAGVNIPVLSVQYALGYELPDVNVEWGTHVARDWQEVVYSNDQEPSTI
jgi:carbamoyl-phosphate synthase large subunit